MSSLFDLAKKLRKNIDVGVENIRGNVRAVSNPQTRSNWATGASQTIGSAIDRTISNPKINPFTPSNYESAAKQFRTISRAPNAPSAVRSVTKYAAPILDAGAGASKYIQGQIISPVREGVKTASDERNNTFTRAIGGLQAASGVWSATPAGVAENFLTGMVATGASGFRNPTDNPNEVGQRLTQNITQPVSVSENMGIKNPYVGLGLDLVLGNPAGAYKLSRASMKLPVKAAGAVKKAGEFVDTAKNTRVRVRNPFKVAEEIQSTEITPLRLSEIVGERTNGTRYRQKIGKGGFQKVEDIGFKTNSGNYWDTERPTQLVEISPGKYRTIYADTMQEAGQKLKGPRSRSSLVRDPNNPRRLVNNEAAFGAMAGFELEYDEEGNFTGIKFNPTKAGVGIAAMAGIKEVGNQGGFASLQDVLGQQQKNLQKMVNADPSDKKAGKALTELNDELAAMGSNIDPKQRLSNLLNDPNRLLKMGYTKSQINQIGPVEARRIVEEGIPVSQYFNSGKPKAAPKMTPKTSGDFYAPRVGSTPVKVKGNKYVQPQPTKEEIDQTVGASMLREMENGKIQRWFNKILNPIKNAPKEVQDIMQNWRTQTVIARTKANEVAQQFTDIPEEDGWKLVKYIQNQTNRNALELDLDVERYAPQIQRLREYFNNTRQEGIAAGLDIKYLDNYLNQLWKETPGQIDAKIKAGAGRVPGFVKDRKIPSYEEGIKLGLTPKYTHPAQLAAHYRQQLDRALANKKMVDDLIQTQLLLPSSGAPADWKTIDSPFFPKVKVEIGKGEAITMDYKAPPDIARALNSIFEMREPGVLSKLADFSKGAQEFALSAGIPFTPVNSFTMANLQKEIMAGRVRGPVVASVTSMSDGATANYFNKNQDVISDMASEGLRVFTNTDYAQMYRNMAENKNLRQRFFSGVGDLFNDAFNEPTFKRFMPILNVEFYKDAYSNALKSGGSAEEARKIAAAATRNFYGITDAFSRPGQVEDALSAAIMAPSFREAMLGFWSKTLKSIDPRTLKDPAYAANRKFLAGAAITWGLYNIVNKATTDRWMHENKPGKELSLEIPLGGGRSFYLPFLFTIGTVPRRIIEGGGELLSGDIAGAGQKVASFASIPVSAATTMITNRNFYGAPIYKEDDPALAKVGKVTAAAAGQMSHPWLRTGVELATGQRTLKEAVPGMLELPLYPSASSDVAHLRGQSISKFKELFEINPASAYAYSEKQKAAQSMKKNKAAVKRQVEISTGKKDPGFFSKLFGKTPQEATPDMLSAYFGVDEYKILPENTAMKKAQKESERRKIVTDILTDEDVLPQQKIEVLGRLGEEVDEADVDYYLTAKLTNDIKTGYVKDLLASAPKEGRYEALMLLTQEVNGQRVLAPGVLTNLYNEGLISKREKDVLNKVTYDKKTGELVEKPGSKKGKSVNVKGSLPSPKLPKIAPVAASISTGQTSLPSIKSSTPKTAPNLLGGSGESFADLVAATQQLIGQPITFDKQKVKVRAPVI